MTKVVNAVNYTKELIRIHTEGPQLELFNAEYFTSLYLNSSKRSNEED